MHRCLRSSARACARLQPAAVDDKLAALAAGQGGPFTRAQAIAARYRADQIRALLRGEWRLLERGVYVDRQLWDAASEAGKHVLQAAAKILASGLSPVASRRTGALVHQLPLLGKPPKAPQLVRAPRRARDRSESAALQVTPLDVSERVVVNGVPVTSLPRTACDVARTTSFREGVVVADAVLRRRVPPAEMAAAVERCGGWPGGPRARRVVRFADGRADGPLESITRVAYALEGLPRPETQVEVWSPEGDFLGLVDFLWREQRVVGEADGLGKYDAPFALQKEKLREEGLRGCGLEVVRNVWDDVWTAPSRARLAARVRQAFGFAARHPEVPGVRFRTPSLDELLTPPWDRPY